jgi:hypothetical protein
VKEPEGYREKVRVFRDRSKKRRLSVDEKRELASNDLKPQHEPYKRKKDWMQLPSADVDDEKEFCPYKEEWYYPEDHVYCPYCDNNAYTDYRPEDDGEL